MQKKIISLILIGLGILVLLGGALSATVFKQESEVTLVTPQMPDSPFVTVSAPVLKLVNETVDVVASSPSGGEVALILARTVDVEGWLGKQPSYSVTGAQNWDTLAVSSPNAQKPEDVDAQEESSATEESSEEGVSLKSLASDMWIVFQSGESPQKLTLTGVEDGLTLMAVSVATDNAAPTVSATWERAINTPVLIPAVVGGSILLLAGVVLLLLPSRAHSAERGSGVSVKPTKRTKKSSTAVSASSPASTLPSGGAPNENSDAQDKKSRFGGLGSKRQKDPHIAPQESKGLPTQWITTQTGEFEATASVVPVPPVRTSSVEPYSSAQSTESAPSVASAASIARAVAREPDMNTGEIRQLGLTRRELREMRAAAAAHSNQNEAAFTAPIPAPIPAPQATGQTGDHLGTRTTSSNWRNAWGVRPEPEAHAAGTTGFGNQAPFTPQESGYAPGQAAQQVPTQLVSSQTEPARWRDSETPATPQRTMGQPNNQAPAQTTDGSVPQPPRPTREAPATRRALYSSYRAEAERLSAESDWPVPAPQTFESPHPDEEGN